jgi:hypothetical protein
MYAGIVTSIDAAFGYEFRSSSPGTFSDQQYPKVDLRAKYMARAAMKCINHY